METNLVQRMIDQCPLSFKVVIESRTFLWSITYIGTSFSPDFGNFVVLFHDLMQYLNMLFNV